MTRNDILSVLPKIETGLKQYSNIQEMFRRSNDVSQDRNFQREFNHFYRVRINSDNQKAFFRIMQAEKSNMNISFGDTLRKMQNETGKCETSFVSKLIATIDDTKPVIDKFVLRNMGLHLSTSKDIDERIIGNTRVYNQLIEKYAEIENSEIGNFLFTQFRNRYKDSEVSNTKMIDFVLWQLR